MDLGGEKGSGGEDKGKKPMDFGGEDKGKRPADSMETGENKGNLSYDSSPFVSGDDSSSEDDQGDDAQSGSVLSSFTESLETSLPGQKRTLSKVYTGHSKSFGNLLDMGTEDAKDLGKKEDRDHKKRRLMIANKTFTQGNPSPLKIGSSSAAVEASSDPPKSDDADADADEKMKTKDDDKNDEDDQAKAS